MNPSLSVVPFSTTHPILLSTSTLPSHPEIDLSCPFGLSGISSSLPYIPRSIGSIYKSPTPSKWTLALSDEIKSLISKIAQKYKVKEQFLLSSNQIKRIVKYNNIADEMSNWRYEILGKEIENIIKKI